MTSYVTKDRTTGRNILMDLLSPHYRDLGVLRDLSQEFLANGYVKLPNLLHENVFTAICDELLQQVPFARGRKFLMGGYETPRFMSVIGGSTLRLATDITWSLYLHWEIHQLLNQLCGMPVFPCLHPDEFMVANFLLHVSETHGWHLDDPAYAVIIVCEAPPAQKGGVLEYIPNWCDFCSRLGVSPDQKVDIPVEEAYKQNLIMTAHHLPGDAYLLRADQVLHRVSGLNSEGFRRIVLNLAYEATPNPTYGHTASMLYTDS